MGFCFVFQPDGRYALFETSSNQIVCENMTRDDLIEFYVENDRERLTKMVDDTLDGMKKGKPQYTRFMLGYEEALALHEAHSPKPKRAAKPYKKRKVRRRT